MIDHYVLFATLQAEHQLKEKRGVQRSLEDAPRSSTSSSEVIEHESSYERPVNRTTKDKK